MMGRECIRLVYKKAWGANYGSVQIFPNSKSRRCQLHQRSLGWNLSWFDNLTQWRCEDDFHVFSTRWEEDQMAGFARSVWKSETVGQHGVEFIHDQMITIWSNEGDQRPVWFLREAIFKDQCDVEDKLSSKLAHRSLSPKSVVQWREVIFKVSTVKTSYPQSQYSEDKLSLKSAHCSGESLSPKSAQYSGENLSPKSAQYFGEKLSSESAQWRQVIFKDQHCIVDIGYL